MSAAQLSKAPLIFAAGVEGRRVPAECDPRPRGPPPSCAAEQPRGRGAKAFFPVIPLFTPHVFPAAFKDVETDLRFGGGTCDFMVFAREGCLACSSAVHPLQVKSCIRRSSTITSAARRFGTRRRHAKLSQSLLLLRWCDGLNQQPADVPWFKAADVRLFQRGGEMLSWFY